MKVQVLVDNPNSWMVVYAKQLVNILKKKIDIKASLIFTHEQVIEGDVLCLLSCEKIFKKLHLNKHNLVVHESYLPKGKGWSPLTWQILEGSSKIPVTLFEAAEKIDSGVVYNQDFINLNGDELLPEIRHIQGIKTIDLIVDFIKNIDKVIGCEQMGEETFYPKRKPIDSELDVNKSIREQFNLLRVCDNERYPAFFIFKGKKYIIKTYKDE